MRTLYFDCSMGAAGDMLTAALLELFPEPEKTVDELNALGIPGLPEVTDLDALPGAYINLAYPLPGGQTAKMLEDSKVYLGNQLEAGGDRCYGLAADQDVMLVCTYGEGGSDPELILYKKRGY